MANGPQTPGQTAWTCAKVWDELSPGELAFRFPRLTAPMRQAPELAEERPRRRSRVLEALLRWLDGQL